MVNVSNVNKTEYAYKAPQITASSAAKAAPNSVMDVKSGETSSSANETKEKNTKLDEIIAELYKRLNGSKELKKKGIKITVEDIKNSGLIDKICARLNVPENGVDKFIEKANEKQISSVMDCLTRAIIDSAENGKVNFENAAKLTGDYMTAVGTGWTINGFKEAQKKNQHSLFDRLKTKEADTLGLLKGYDKIEDVPEKVLEDAIDNFFNNVLLTGLKNAKTKEDKDQIFKAQLQTFGRLLVNTPEKDRKVLLHAVANLAADNRLTGFEAYKQSFETTEAYQNSIQGFGEESVKEICLQKDADGNYMAGEDTRKLVAAFYKDGKEEDIKNRHDDFQPKKDTFFKKYENELKIIAEKEKNGEELTETEEQLKRERDYFTNYTAGEYSGTAINQNIASDFKKKFLTQLNTDAFKQADTYKDVMKYVSDFVDDYTAEHPEMNISKEELVKLLDDTTNGNYSAIASGSDAELKTPEEAAAAESESTPAVGFTQKEAPDANALKEIKAAVIKKEEPQKFTVEKSATNPIASSTETDVENIKKEKSTVRKLKALNKSGLWNVPFVRNMVANRLARITNPLQVLQDLPSDMVKDIAPSLVRKGKLDEDDIYALNLSSADKNILKGMYLETKKAKEEEKEEAAA